MKILRLVPGLLMLAMTSCLWGTALSKRLHLGHCTVNVHTHELRHQLHQIHKTAVKDDSHMGVRLLKRDMMKSIQATEGCCFLRPLLRLYVERVFSSYSGAEAQDRKTASLLANAFLSIKKDLRLCHDQMRCQCGEETRMKIDALLANFNKLEQPAASVKAVAELDGLIEWLEALGQSQTGNP